MKYFLVLVWSLVTSQLLAQSEEPLSTDRPGEGTDAASVVGAGIGQLETGVFQEWEIEGGYSLGYYPTALLRYGILDRVELRLSSGLFTGGPQAGVGWSPLDLATKVALIEEAQGWIPQAALLVGLTLPATGSEAVQSNFTQPRVVLLLNHSINSWLGITTNLGAHWENDSPETIYRYAMSFDFSLSERIGAFAEFYGDLPEASATSHLFNAGFTYLLTNDLQLDLAAGTALTDNAPDFYIGGGVSWRW
ncbi:MAG: transporter [Tunicatimonas sp.]